MDSSTNTSHPPSSSLLRVNTQLPLGQNHQSCPQAPLHYLIPADHLFLTNPIDPLSLHPPHPESVHRAAATNHSVSARLSWWRMVSEQLSELPRTKPRETVLLFSSTHLCLSLSVSVIDLQNYKNQFGLKSHLMNVASSLDKIMQQQKWGCKQLITNNCRLLIC